MAILDANNITVCMHAKPHGTKHSTAAKSCVTTSGIGRRCTWIFTFRTSTRCSTKVRSEGGTIENEFRNQGPMPTAFCCDPFGTASASWASAESAATPKAAPGIPCRVTIRNNHEPLRAREWLSRSLSRPLHPGWLRCSSVKYQQYAPSSRLASRAPRSRSSTDSTIRGPSARSNLVRALTRFLRNACSGRLRPGAYPVGCGEERRH